MTDVYRPAGILLLAAAWFAPLSAQTTPSVSTTVAMTGFGASIVMGSGEIIVGRTGETLLMPLLPTRTGGLHRFLRTPAGWSEEGVPVPDELEIGNRFGQRMALDGGVLAVAAPGQAEGRGEVFVYGRTADSWAVVGAVRAPEGQPADSMGYAVAVTGDILVAGAPGVNERAGVVYLFEHREGTWALRATLTASGSAPGARFGSAVAADGNLVLVGAPGEVAGAAYLFERTADGEWAELERWAPEGVQAFGYAVALAGDHAVIGAPATNRQSGTAVLVKRSEGAWQAMPPLNAEGVAQGLFGLAVAVSGQDVVIGSPGVRGFTGAAYRYRVDAEGQVATVDTLHAGALAPTAFYGASVAAGASAIVVGAVGLNYGEGAVFVFNRDGDDLTEPVSLYGDAGSEMTAMVGEDVACVGGLAGEFDCDEVELLALLPPAAMGAERGVAVSDVWGWTDPDTGREYAIVGRFDGTSFVDVSDPNNPEYLGNLPNTEGTPGSLWRDVKVYRNHAFIVADAANAHGIQIFDLTALRGVTSPTEFEETARYDGIHSAHNIVINEETGFAYAVGNSSGGETCGGGLHMVNIQDPANPAFAGCWADPSTGRTGTGYTHDAQCVVYRGPDAEHAGREICFNASETALGIADVTDKVNPVALASASYPNVGYSHQGWLTEDHRFFYMNDELDEIAGMAPMTRTLVWDVTDLDDPILVNEHEGTNAASDHNLYVRGDLMYQSNYVSGLRILDVSDPAQPREVAFFDTVPWGTDRAGFAGSWSNYPYFESGIIVVTSMHEGLFVLWHRPEEIIP